MKHRQKRLGRFGLIIRSLNTFVHEIGHALMAIILGGSVESISLNQNLSGVCKTKSKGRLRASLVALSGYTFSALFSYWLIVFHDSRWAKLFVYFFIIMSIILLIFWIKNKYGIIWTLSFLAINLALVLVPELMPRFGGMIMLGFGIIIGLENLGSTLALIRLSIISPKKAGDASNLSKNTRIPAFVWSLVFFGFSLWFSYLSFRVILAFFE